jgi:hypothetical protein
VGDDGEDDDDDLSYDEDDADSREGLGTPIIAPAVIRPEDVAEIVSMGFTEDQARGCVRAGDCAGPRVCCTTSTGVFSNACGRVHAPKGLALPRASQSGEIAGSRRLRSTLAAAPVLFAHAVFVFTVTVIGIILDPRAVCLQCTDSVPW